MQAQSRIRRGGFTLIELMVVVAIISLLAAMLLPTLSSAKGKARRIECLSGLRQLNLALTMYADDFEEQFPPRAEREFSWIYKLEPYYTVPKVLRCPIDRLSEPYDYSYLINGFNDWFEANLAPAEYELFKAWIWPKGMKTTGAPQPSDTITFGEKVPESRHVHMDFYQSLGNDVEEIDHGKHNDGSKRGGGANFGFMDGSVRMLKYWRSLTPENLWAVTPDYRSQAIPER
jgi:prepilin-type N-terminal cleavage/methylation domain-containing protein/prepilin-type processing-associated H-X9-DG protein